MSPVSIAFKGIRGRRNFATLGEKVQRQLRQQLQRDAQRMKKDFEKTTATWQHKPNFEVRTLQAGGDMVALVGTDDEIYGYVNFGTPRHPIPKSGTAHLVFQWGGPGSYKAKTRRGVVGSRSGGPSGPIVHRKRVMHPGTEPRNFAQTIQQKWQKEIPKGAAQAVRGAIAAW